MVFNLPVKADPHKELLYQLMLSATMLQL